VSVIRIISGVADNAVELSIDDLAGQAQLNGGAVDGAGCSISSDIVERTAESAISPTDTSYAAAYCARAGGTSAEVHSTDIAVKARLKDAKRGASVAVG